MDLRPLHDDREVGAQNGHQGNTRPFIPSSSQKMMIPGRSRFGNYQPTCRDKCVLVAAIVSNSLLLGLAGFALFVGILLNTDRGSYADLCSDNEWFVAAGCMLAVGSLLFIIAILSFFAIGYKQSRVLGVLILMLIFLFFCEMAAGIYAFARRDYIEERFSACLNDAYQNKYMHKEFPHVTEAWDTFQERWDCCGVDDPLDYRSNNQLDQPPDACGDTSKDALGRQPCLPVIEEKVLVLFYYIGGAAFIVACLQIGVIIFNGVLLCILHKREEYE